MRNIKKILCGDVRYAYWIRTSWPAHGKYSRVGTYGTRYLGTFSGYMWVATHSWEATDCGKALRCGNFKIISIALWFYEAVTGYGITYVPHNFFNSSCAQ